LVGGVIGVGEGTAVQHARIVDQQVQARGALGEVGQRGLPLPRVAHVEPAGDGAVVAVGPGHVVRDVVDADGPTAVEELFGGQAADSAAGAGDESRGLGEVHGARIGRGTGGRGRIARYRSRLWCMSTCIAARDLREYIHSGTRVAVIDARWSRDRSAYDH